MQQLSWATITSLSAPHPFQAGRSSINGNGNGNGENNSNNSYAERVCHSIDNPPYARMDDVVVGARVLGRFLSQSAQCRVRHLK